MIHPLIISNNTKEKQAFTVTCFTVGPCARAQAAESYSYSSTTLLFAKRCHEWSSRGGWSTHEACEVSSRVVRRVPPIADAVLEQLGLTQKGDHESCGGHSHFRDSRSTKGRLLRGRETGGGGGSTGLEHKSTVPPRSEASPNT